MTLRENCAAFERIEFRPRNAVAECAVRASARPSQDKRSSCRFCSRPSEASVSSFRGANASPPLRRELQERHTSFRRSPDAGSKTSAASNGPVWYQLYLVAGREVASAAIERARNAGFRALVVTIDTAVAGLTRTRQRNGAKELCGGTPVEMLPYMGQLFARPRWLVDFLRDGGMMKFPNVVLPQAGPMDTPTSRPLWNIRP